MNRIDDLEMSLGISSGNFVNTSLMTKEEAEFLFDYCKLVVNHT